MEFVAPMAFPPPATSIKDPSTGLPTQAPGATAQTSGFAQAGKPSESNSSPFAGFAGFAGEGIRRLSQNNYPITAAGPYGIPVPMVAGGLGSSPNVPAPGTSIDPATGKPHVAGLTRAELEAKKAAEARRSSEGAQVKDGRRISDLTGREQAAAQLVGPGDITPGHELPGGWGPTKQLPLPGTSPNSPTSVYDDVAQGLEKVGHVAYNLIPQGIKDAFNQEALDKGKQPEGQPPKGRRSSVGLLFEQAKHAGEKVLHDVQGQVQGARRESLKPTGRASGTIGSEGSVLGQVKEFFNDVKGFNAHDLPAGLTGPPGPRTSLPSDEPSGAQPGEHTSGVGALPGTIAETGVAVLPDEKNEVNQGFRPGETAGVGAFLAEPKSEPQPSHDAHQAVTAKDDAAPVTAPVPVPAEYPRPDAPTTAEQAAPPSHVAPTSDSSLAPPLPATFLGLGAAKGATDLESTGVIKPTTTEDPSLHSLNPGTDSAATGPSEADTLSPNAAAETRHANDRTTSAASVTAIRHGHEGHKPSQLAESTLPDATIPEGQTTNHVTEAATASTAGAAAAAAGEKLNADAAESHATNDLAPRSATDGVGHPSTRDASTTREPGTYPKADHAGAAIPDQHAEQAAAVKSDTARDPTPPQSDSNTTHTNTSVPVTPQSPSTKLHDHATTASPKTAAAGLGNGDSAKGHTRSGSTASSSSNGKKKVGFMNKLKGEMKVIGGKLQNDEQKVKEGEKLKHGE